MKTIRVKTKEELKNVQELIAVRDFSGREVFYADKETFKMMVKRKIIKKSGRFHTPISGTMLKCLKNEYAVEIIVTDDVNIEEMAKNALIAAIKDYCYKVGGIDDNKDDILLHYIDLNANNIVAVPDFNIGEVKITKVAYDNNVEYGKFSGVMVWVERTTGQFPNNILGVFNAEECSFQMLTKVVELLSSNKTKQPINIEDALKCTLDTFFAGDYEHNLYAVDVPLTIVIHGVAIECESVWVDKTKDYDLHVTAPSFEGDIKIFSLSEDNLQRVKECLDTIMDKTGSE